MIVKVDKDGNQYVISENGQKVIISEKPAETQFEKEQKKAARLKKQMTD